MSGAFGFSLFAVMVTAAISHNVQHRADTIIGVIWALGMAFGIILVDLTPRYNVDMMSYLFGSILTVSRSDFFITAVEEVMMTTVVVYYYQDLLAMSYDRVDKICITFIR